MLWCEIVHIRKALFHQLFGTFVHKFKIIRAVDLIVPPEAEPSDILFDCLDILRILLHRIRIVKTQVAPAAILFGQSKIEADRFCVPKVQVSVRLRRKTRYYRLHRTVRKVAVNNFFDKVFRFVF